MGKKRETLAERMMKTLPVYGERYQLEHLRDWDKEARLLIHKELDNSLDSVKQMLKIALEHGNTKSAREVDDIRKDLTALRQAIKSAPAPYSPTMTSMKNTGAEEIQKVINLDEQVYSIAQEISMLMEEANEAYSEDEARGISLAKSTSKQVKEVKRLYTQRHAIITRPKEKGKPPYD